MTRDRIREIIATGTIGLGSTSEQCAAALILAGLGLPNLSIVRSGPRMQKGRMHAKL